MTSCLQTLSVGQQHRRPVPTPTRFGARAKTTLVAALWAALGAAPTAVAQCLPVQPVPTLPNTAPTDVFNGPEHRQALASTYLQGLPAREKIGVVTWENTITPAVPAFDQMKSYVFINNPSATMSINVTVEYRDQAGNLLAANAVFIQPNGSHAENAFPIGFGPNGHGIVRIIGLTENDVFVGAVVKQSHRYFGYTPPENWQNLYPNMVAAEQVQAIGTSKTLTWGPLPEDYRLTSPAFLHRLNYLFWVYNPSPTTPALVTFNVVSRTGQVLVVPAVTLQPLGSIVSANLFQLLVARYGSPVVANPNNDDWMVTVTGSQAIQGEGMMVSVYDPAQPGLAGGRFRIGSTLLAQATAKTLQTSELTTETNGSKTSTLIGIWNTTAGSIGPITIEYRNRGGTTVATDTIATFGANAIDRIGAGLPSSPNYPAGQFAGSVRILSCATGLIGWVMRPSEADATSPIAERYREVYGELLDGISGREPGNGKAVVSTGGVTRFRQVGPFGAVDTVNPWPSFSTALNSGVSNVGSYVWLFHDFNGAALATTPLPAFPGLTWGATAFTYQDNTPPLVSPVSPAVAMSAKFESAIAGVRGIALLGGPLYNVQFGEAEFDFPPPTGGTYTGPGDTVQ
jgi:hypothetical protein